MIRRSNKEYEHSWGRSDQKSVYPKSRWLRQAQNIPPLPDGVSAFGSLWWICLQCNWFKEQSSGVSVWYWQHPLVKLKKLLGFVASFCHCSFQSLPFSSCTGREKEQLFSSHHWHVACDVIEHYPFTTIFLSKLKNPALSSCSLYRKLSLPSTISVAVLRNELERAEYQRGYQSSTHGFMWCLYLSTLFFTSFPSGIFHMFLAITEQSINIFIGAQLHHQRHSPTISQLSNTKFLSSPFCASRGWHFTPPAHTTSHMFPLNFTFHFISQLLSAVRWYYNSSVYFSFYYTDFVSNCHLSLYFSTSLMTVLKPV